MSRDIFAFTNAIVRTPGHSVVDGLRAGGGPGPTYAAVLAEHDAYVAALRDAGLAVEVLPALEAYPDAIFVEDVALTFPEGAILLRPGAPSRAGEVAAIRPVLASHFDTVLELTSGHVDGGDVLVMPDRVLIGLSDRTDVEGADALCRLLATLGRQGELVEIPPGILHLKSGCSLIGEDTAIVNSISYSDISAFCPFGLMVCADDEAGAANVLRINDRLLINAQFPGAAANFENSGAQLVRLDTRAIALIDAGLSCMSLRW